VESKAKKPIVRLKDIAEELGVSIAAVSKALRDSSDISPALKRTVLDRARSLNYQPDLAARSLITRRTFAVGLIVPDITHSFFGTIARAIARKLHPHGYTLILADSEENFELERREIQQLLARRVDGIILASAQQADRESDIVRIQKQGVELVLVDREFPGIAADFSGVDNVEIGRLATEHLIRRGCRRIAHLSCRRITTGVGRLEGYRRALRQGGFQVDERYEIEVENSDSGGYAGAKELLRCALPIDGLFCFSDPVGMGAVHAILGSRRGIPRDIAVIGAGKVHYSDRLRVPLSTVDMKSDVLGERAAEFLLARMEGSKSKPQSFYAPLELVARNSTAGTCSTKRGRTRVPRA
jgi:LacI family transcriptional regulator